MAIKAAVRWQPDAFRTSLETTIQNFDPTTTPPSGTLIRMAQLVVYDDTEVTGGNYAAGDPATERNLVLLYAEPIGMELALFQPLNAAASAAAWATALQAFANRVTPAVALLVKAQRAAMRTAPIVLS